MGILEKIICFFVNNFFITTPSDVYGLKKF